MNNPETDVETRGAGTDAAGKLSVIFGFESTQPMQYTTTFTPKPDWMETENVSSDLADILSGKFDARNISKADREVLKEFLLRSILKLLTSYNMPSPQMKYLTTTWLMYSPIWRVRAEGKTQRCILLPL